MNEDGLLGTFYKGGNSNEKLENEKNIKNSRYSNIVIG